MQIQQFFQVINPKRPRVTVFVALSAVLLFAILAKDPIFGVASERKSTLVSLFDQSDTSTDHPTLWPYQCIDTMKFSRDRAREWQQGTLQAATIASQSAAIKSLGANCIAIDTPYDDEFLPYLQAWVSAARQQNLKIWFRGNWASWEGWFDYPATLTPAEQLAKTKNFVISHKNLFADGDIFTPSPEAENGGPFHPVDSAEKQAQYRQFLVDEYSQMQQLFASLNKKVTINWLSMSGGVAKATLDGATVQAIGHTVTIDHYVKSAKEMTDYIVYFATNYGAHVVLGEFGAPIPDINGTFTEYEQANFVQGLFQVLYQYNDTVSGINYWVLNDGSTALINPDGSERKVAEVIRNFYMPGVISGTVTDSIGIPLGNVPVTTTDKFNQTVTAADGTYQVVVPAGNGGVIIGGNNYQPYEKELSVGRNSKTVINVSLEPVKTNFIYQIIYNLRHIRGLEGN